MTNLEQILIDLHNHKHKKEELLIYYINKRLTESLESYYSELSSSVKFLNDKEELRVLKKLNKYD